MTVNSPKFVVGDRVKYRNDSSQVGNHIITKVIIYLSPHQINKYQLKKECNGQLLREYVVEFDITFAPKRMSLKEAIQIVVDARTWNSDAMRDAVSRLQEELNDDC